MSGTPDGNINGSVTGREPAGKGYTIAAACIPVGEVSPAAVAAYEGWLSEGKEAGMGYMRNHADIRRSPELLLPGARSMIILAIPFPLTRRRPAGNPYLASYALGSDYHDIIRSYLKPAIAQRQETSGGEWRICIDSAPLMERYWGVCSGLAGRCDSGMVSVPGLGTAFFLCEILTTLTLSELGLPERERLRNDEITRFFGPEWSTPHSDRANASCTHCGACRRVCPGAALGKGGEVDARRCLSYLTIEHRGEWSEPEAKEAMATPGGRGTLFGCDRCVVGCPLNLPPIRKEEELSFLPELMPRAELLNLSFEDCIMMDQSRFSALFRNSPVKRGKLEGFLRNARNMMGETSGGEELSLR